MANTVDREFLRLTIPHHRQGVKMGELAVERASGDEVRKMAAHIVEDQRRDISKLERHLDAAGLSSDDLQPPDEKAAAMQQMLDHLSRQVGHMFDASFLAMMMNHHVGALGVAVLETTGGEHDELVSMAESTHDKQLQELSEMRGMLARAGAKA